MQYIKCYSNNLFVKLPLICSTTLRNHSCCFHTHPSYADEISFWLSRFVPWVALRVEHHDKVTGEHRMSESRIYLNKTKRAKLQINTSTITNLSDIHWLYKHILQTRKPGYKWLYIFLVDTLLHNETYCDILTIIMKLGLPTCILCDVIMNSKAGSQTRNKVKANTRTYRTTKPSDATFRRLPLWISTIRPLQL